MTRIEIGQISGIGKSLFVICLLAGMAITAATRHPAGIVGGAALGIYLMFAIKVVQQWEKVAVLRLGRYVGLRGPGNLSHHTDRRNAQRLCRSARPRGQRFRRIYADA